jgi:poly(hydroxyalkanoate) depolymerase family esterase
LVQALLNALKRKLALWRERVMKNDKEQAFHRRRRQRVADWDKSNQRRPVEQQSCAFCNAARDWLAGQWRRFADAARATGRALARRFRQWFHLPTIRATRTGGEATEGVFRRQSYPGSRRRRFELYLPRGYEADRAMPLLMVLHGCRQTSVDIRRIAGFDRIADREGFIVVYPFVTGYSGLRIRNCWGWWLGSEIAPGAGEVEDLWQIIDQIRDDVSVDERRIHVTGLSSGGGMAVAAMVVHHTKIASGAAVAGVPYSESARAVAYGAPGGVEFKLTEQLIGSMVSVMGEQGRPSPIFIVHSENDPVVGSQAARNIRDSWAGFFDVDVAKPTRTDRGVTEGAPWVHEVFSESRKRSAVETLFIEGRGHGWYGGHPGQFSYPQAPNISELIWRFFKRHPLHSGFRNKSRRRQARKTS